MHEISHLQFYYSQRFTKLFVSQNNAHDSTTKYTLYIAVKIPVSSMESEIITYQAITHPVTHEFNNSDSSKGYTTIRLTKEFFIETKLRHSWSELSHADYRYCVSILDSMCPALSIDRDRNDLSCLAALFYNNDQVIREKCNFEYYPEACVQYTKLSFLKEHT